MEEIEFSRWLFDGRPRQGKNMLPDGLNWLFYFAGTLESRINKQVVYQKIRKNPAYTHLLGTILLLIFSKKSHLYVYSHLYFYSLLKFHIFLSCLFRCLCNNYSFDLLNIYHTKVLIHSLIVGLF